MNVYTLNNQLCQSHRWWKRKGKKKCTHQHQIKGKNITGIYIANCVLYAATKFEFLCPKATMA